MPVDNFKMHSPLALFNIARKYGFNNSNFGSSINYSEDFWKKIDFLGLIISFLKLNQNWVAHTKMVFFGNNNFGDLEHKSAFVIWSFHFIKECLNSFTKRHNCLVLININLSSIEFSTLQINVDLNNLNFSRTFQVEFKQIQNFGQWVSYLTNTKLYLKKVKFDGFDIYQT